MTTYHERPVAVLMPFDGEPIIVPVSNPPQLVLQLVVHLPPVMSLVDVEAGRTHLPANLWRRFSLEPTMRAKDHRWMRFDHDGRSQTPEDGYVYFEVR